jgi:dihydrolipoamide dehydrogenase
LTERGAADAGRHIRIGRFPLIGNGKAIAIGDSNGLIKTLFDAQTGELLGAHMVGPGVTELIHGFAIAMGAENDRSRTDRHRVSTPDDLGGDARVGARRFGRALHI